MHSGIAKAVPLFYWVWIPVFSNVSFNGIESIGMKSELEVLRDVTTKFAAGRIAYMLTGSMAMNYYAEPRMTRDIDLVVALHAGQIEKIIQLFGPEYYVAREAIVGSIQYENLFNLIHNETFVKVDCIIRKKSEYRLNEFQRRKEVQVNDFIAFVVSKEDLIISKLDWAKDSHSQQQMRDIKNLMQTGYDANYLRHWIGKLNLSESWEKCLNG